MRLLNPIKKHSFLLVSKCDTCIMFLLIKIFYNSLPSCLDDLFPDGLGQGWRDGVADLAILVGDVADKAVIIRETLRPADRKKN